MENRDIWNRLIERIDQIDREKFNKVTDLTLNFERKKFTGGKITGHR